MPFFPEPITVIRSGGGGYVNGDYKSIPSSTLTMDANVQPLKGRDLLILPEGERTKESIKVITDDELRCTRDAGGIDADIIIWQGRQFKVHTVGYYGKLIPHYESIAINVNKLTKAD